MARILVSACLVGCDCSYRGDSNYNEAIKVLSAEHVLIPVCPEQLGGLMTPRRPSEIVGDEVINNEGENVTAQYKKGAKEALKIYRLCNADFAILKANSPSCGKGSVYDGTFSHKKIKGNGITAALFLDNNIKIFTENEIEGIKHEIQTR